MCEHRPVVGQMEVPLAALGFADNLHSASLALELQITLVSLIR